MKRFSVVVVVLLALGVASTAFGEEKILTMEECVEIALEHNPDIVRGEFTVKIAGKDVTVALSNFLPSASSYLQFYQFKQGPTSPRIVQGIYIDAQPAIEREQYSSGVSVNQSILDGGYSIFNYMRSRSLKNSATFGFEDTKQTTILLVKERYYNLIKSEKLLEVAEETLRGSEESFKRAEVLYEVGKAPKSDVLQAKFQLETDRLGLIRAQNDLAIARASLNHVLGFDVDNDIKVEDNLNIPEIDVTYQDAMSYALSDHPLLKQRSFDAKAAKDGIGAEVAQFLPSLSAFFQYSWSHQNLNEIKNYFDTDYSMYYGLYLSVPIFQGFSRVANTAKARLSYKSSIEALEQGKRDVALELKQSYFELEQSRKSIAVSRNAVEAADEGLRLNREKYTLGAGTMLDLITAQVSYAQAQSDHIQALYDHKYAVARLQKAMGKLER